MTKVIAFDTETRGLAWDDPEEQAFLASWADADSEGVADLSKPEDVETFTKALESADIVVAHNAPFDVHQTRETLGFDPASLDAVIHDTDIMARLALPAGQSRPSYKLKDLAQTYISDDAKDAEDAIDDMAKSIGVKLKSTGGYYEVWRAYPEVMEEYAALDARYTYDLHTKFSGDLRGNSAWDLEQRVQPILIEAERTGVALDTQVVDSLIEEYKTKQETARERLLAHIPEDALSGDALAEALVELGVPLYRKTKKTGKLQTGKFALQEFADEYPIVDVLIEYQSAGKFLSTYLEPMEGREVVHTSFGQCDAWTGRMASRRPNMQNIPVRGGARVREMFVPRPGHSFVVCDYDSIEVRLLAYYMGRQEYRDLIADGLDPHAWMAAQIHGGVMEDFAKGSDGEALRNQAKNTMFAITYGAGAPRVADMNEISREEAKSLITKIKKSLPGYYRLNKRIRTKIEAEGHVNTLFGRRQLVSPDKAYVGLNALIQGSAADVMKQGLVNVNEAVAPYGGKPLLVVHDEVVVEVPTENAEHVKQLTENAMTEAFDLKPPLAVSGSVVHTNYADA